MADKAWLITVGEDGILSVVTEFRLTLENGYDFHRGIGFSGYALVVFLGSTPYVCRRDQQGEIDWELDPNPKGLSLYWRRNKVSYDEFMANLSLDYPLDLQFLLFNIELFDGRFNQ